MAFNQPLSLDTSSLTSMHSMFKQTEAFNQPLHFSDTSRVEIMKEMFKVLGTSPLCTAWATPTPSPISRPGYSPPFVWPPFHSAASVSV